MLELQNVSVVLNKGTKLEKNVLKNVNLKILEGEFVTIIGGNGAGKSTLMNILAGDILPDQGSIFIDKKNVAKLTTHERSHLIARVFQDPAAGTFANLTIEENMSIAFKRGKARGLRRCVTTDLKQQFKEILKELELGLELRLADEVQRLSGGQRQALSLVMATMQSSKILLLDEHTAALDPKVSQMIMDITKKLIRHHRFTALMITHSMHQALEYGNRTLMMQQGQVVRDIDGECRKRLHITDLLRYFET